MIAFRKILFSTLMLFPIFSLAAVCENIYDGDKAISIAQGMSGNYTLNLMNNSSLLGEVTYSQLKAVYNAKEKIQRVVGIFPKFVVCGDAEPNAFAFEQGDGAVVGVSLGMLKLLNGDEDMAAAVIGHEIAHHTQNHRFKAKQSELVTNIISSLIGFYIEAKVQQRYKIKGVGSNIAAIGSILTISKFSRDHEREADEVGFRYMIDAGYNPEASIRLAEAFLRRGSIGTGLFYETHPSWNERALRIKSLIAGSSKAQQLIASKELNEKVVLDENATLDKQIVTLSSNVALNEVQVNVQLALKAIADEDFNLAEKYSRLAANSGDAICQYNLGLMYEKGNGVIQSIEESVKYIRLAAKQGLPVAMAKLGYFYLTGTGVNKDVNEGIKYTRLAAVDGDKAAQYNLGLSYVNGTIHPPNLTEAIKWWRLAAEQGVAIAQASLGSIYNGYGGTVVKKDFSEALRWYRLAVAQNHAGAQASLGHMYIVGSGVTKDVVEGHRLIKLSADQNESIGQYSLGTLYLNGVGVEKNEEEAVKWFKLAAMQGHPTAIAYLNKNGIIWK